jgi:hypothetical protein
MKKHYFFILLFFPVFLVAQIIPITSTEPLDLSVYGEATTYPGVGEYEVFLSADNVLDKPIIVVDGFDPGDSRNIPGLYSLLDFAGTSGTQNLGDLVRAEGFDVVVLNFPTYTRAEDAVIVDGGADFMERNAMILVELIETINAEKAANSPEQNVIIGPSMGGIISRYALNYMENQDIDTDTRLYISFDSPHLGANVPIGLQHQLNYLAFNNTNPVAEIQPLIGGLLKSPAARQLLIDHFESHLSAGSTVDFDPSRTLPEPHPYRAEFETRINSFTANGFPEMVRNISIINGSGIGSPYFAQDGITVVTNGFTVVDATLPVVVPTPFGNFTINLEIEINFTPAAGNPVQVSRFFAPIPAFPDVESIADSGTTNFDGVDAAPGGLFDLSGLTGNIGGAGGVAADLLNAFQIDKFSFIPSVSALALVIEDETEGDNINWFHTIDLDGRSTTDNTPFANTFLPDDNEPHVQLTQANVDFALMEILMPALSLSDNSAIAFQLEKNPVRDELVLLSNTQTNANISIIDLTGKIILNTKLQLENRTRIPLDLASGFYILNVSDENNVQFNTKFIVNN